MPILKNASAHASALDVTSISRVEVGDEVVLLGRQGGQQIRAEDVARRISKPVDVLHAELPTAIRRYFH